MAVASELAAFVTEMQSRAIPEKVWQEVELSFVDTVASMLAGVPFPTAKMISESPLHRTQGVLNATVIGYGGRRSILDTAILHGVLAHVADYDDVSWSLMGHPSATLVPALLALGECSGSSGQQIGTAYLAGYEVAIELGHATAPEHYLGGWHATSTIGSIAVAAACASLLELDHDHTVYALGIAASSSSGLRQNFGSDVKSLHAGFAARNGIEAALLARDGFTSNTDAIDGRWGFFRTFDGRENGHLRNDAFSGFSILKPGTLRKQYPSCGATHQAIDAARRIGSMHPARSEDIASVQVGVAPACFAPLIDWLPTTPLEGKFSMPFTVATALLDGEVGTRHFNDAHLNSLEIRSLMPLVTMTPDAALATIPANSNEASAARVTVVYRNGSQESVEVRFPSGAPENPLSGAELRNKFFDCAQGVITPHKAEDAFRLLSGLRDLPKIAPTLEMLVP